ncbi:TetR/AcrR family transcriptional regulator [Nocardia mexicana]|uniref:TetR family transcriptional regulator n=1 Tax=Nocardia mexicana TaxID=279262 RepID=A0A370GRW8_9NOCA|nr:TetR/AcrR family transcriptional regulator [Nocardia mexicana]RDI44683.1 TetR family transcriptional regulator [Nocardia mexicana]
MVEDSAVEQAKQLMTLLWREELPPRPGARGPKQTVSVDDVVGAAVAIADRDGYDRISIRAVAAELGLGPMSLYTYVPSKEALIILMVDAVAAEDAPIDPALPVRERMAAIAVQVRAELLAHPWLLEVPPWRLVLGPGRMRRYERQLAALEGVGLTDIEMDRVIAVLSEFATGNARMAVAARRSAREMTDAEWWEVHGPLLTQVMPTADYPLSGRVGAAVGEKYQAPGDPDGAFYYGLDRMLTGIEAGLTG